MDTENQEIYTVSQLNNEARMVIEENFQTIWVMGELSNLARPSSGHIYFSLKDERSQVRCAMFRMNRRRVDFTPENGQQVLVQAQVSLYEARGDYQLIVRDMKMAGAGALHIAFEKLKNKLTAEGLFEEDNKRELPELPQRIGVVTSSTGAAIRDIITVLKRRFSNIPLIIYPCLVQGDLAAAQIVTALETANQRDECDVLILARGGGSLEDLWPFNEEIVARAVFDSQIPVVTGVGHEVDFTIADFVADRRAATPSAAAELVSPNKTEWLQYLTDLAHDLAQSVTQQIKQYQTHLQHLTKRLRHPGERLREQSQRLDQLEQSLVLAWNNLLLHKQSKLEHTQAKLFGLSPAQQIKTLSLQVHTTQERMRTSLKHNLSRQHEKISALARALDTVSPLKTLDRGYSVITQSETQNIISDAKSVKRGDKISARLAKGKLECVVETVS